MSDIAPNLSLPSTALIPVIGALVADELVLMRRGQGSDASVDLLKAFNWQATTIITLEHRSKGVDHEIIVDSLEWMAIATRVVTFFQMQQSGIEDYLLRVHTLAQWAEVVAKSRELGATDICFATSGSTGTPKLIVHQWRSLSSEIDFFQQYYCSFATPPARIISLVPAHHIYGFLFGVMLPQALHVPVIRGFAAYATLLNGTLAPGDLLITIPAVLQQFERRLLMAPKGISLVCSAGPSPLETMQRLQQSGMTTTEVYGSSETAAIGVRADTSSHYKLLPRWQRRSGQLLFDTLAKAEVFPSDNLQWQDNEHFQPCGRWDFAVSVKGINVFPVEIAGKLAQHPQVRDARVRLVSEHASSGLKALLIVAAPLSAEEEDKLISDVKSWAQTQLSAPELPVYYRVATAIPLNNMGKESDWPLLSQ